MFARCKHTLCLRKKSPAMFINAGSNKIYA